MENEIIEKTELKITEDPKLDLDGYVTKILSNRELLKIWVKEVMERLDCLEAKNPFKAESPNQENLRKAIALTSIDCKIPEQNSKNRFEKTIPSLDDALNASRDACKKNNLGITHYETSDENGKPILLSTVTETISGEFKVFTTYAPPLKNETEAFSRASGYSYAKRKFLLSLFNLGGEE